MFDANYATTVDDAALKEAFSLAALRVVVGGAYGTFQETTRGDDALGIDARCSFSMEFPDEPDALQDVETHFQLKATSRPETVFKKEECWALRVKVAQLQKYVRRRQNPLILALLVLPEDAALEDCVEVDEEKTSIKGLLYWTPLEGFPLEEDKETNTIYIPKKNVLTPNALTSQIVVPVCERKGLRYERQN